MARVTANEVQLAGVAGGFCRGAYSGPGAVGAGLHAGARIGGGGGGAAAAYCRHHKGVPLFVALLVLQVVIGGACAMGATYGVGVALGTGVV